MTAVEWLDRWFRDNPEATYEEGDKALKKAKQMEKMQSINDYNHGQNNGYMYRDGMCDIIKPENYYNETYGKK